MIRKLITIQAFVHLSKADTPVETLAAPLDYMAGFFDGFGETWTTQGHSLKLVTGDLTCENADSLNSIIAVM